MFFAYLRRQLKLSRWARCCLMALAIVTSASTAWHSNHGLEHLSDVDCYSCVVRHDGVERTESMALSVRDTLILRIVPLPAVRATSGGDALLNFTRPPPA